jgi:lipoprotein signal peptidase
MPWLAPLIAGTCVFAADQLSKRHVLAQPRFGQARAHRPFVSINCIINRRAGAMPLSMTWALIVAWLLCATLALIVLSQEPLARSLTGVTGIGMAIGGITGNFIDMLRRGGIVDFIAIGPWRIFNVADAAIVAGLALAIVALV